MKNKIFLIGLIIIIFYSCTTTTPILKSAAYHGMYEEKPISILLMPPINRSTNVEAKNYFHTTLNVPIANAGFYVIPPFLSMEFLKRESAYDSELFLNSSLTKFYEIFGADLVLFTVINKWDKSSLAANINVEIEYIFKSTKTNKILFTRKGNVTYNTSVSLGAGGGLGILADLTASAINTAATKYIDVAKVCNSYTFKDLPAGKYSPNYNIDGEQPAGKKEFKVKLNSNYQ